MCKRPKRNDGLFQATGTYCRNSDQRLSLRTGDIGVFEDGKYLKITDRKKEMFKTSGGKYVAPQPIENKMKESPFVEQLIILGADKKFVGALIVPSFINLRECEPAGHCFYQQ